VSVMTGVTPPPPRDLQKAVDEQTLDVKERGGGGGKGGKERYFFPM
jgi:hypothetical protein